MTIPIQGGKQANYTGAGLEKIIRDRLDERGYVNLHHSKFDPGCYLEQPIYSMRYYVGKSVYETPLYCDFVVYHPVKWPQKLIIESKWQQVGGSVDEKFPFLVLNIQERYSCPTIVLLDGGGYKKGAEKWLRDQSGNGNLLHVFSISEFQKWVNLGNL